MSIILHGFLPPPARPPAVTQERYREQEADLHRQLCALAQNAVWLRNYACSALLIEGNLLSRAGEEVGTVPAEQVKWTFEMDFFCVCGGLLLLGALRATCVWAGGWRAGARACGYAL